jgi:hypothetical protein
VSRRSLLLTAAVVLLPVAVPGQQQPIYGCRQSINCRPSPVGASALNDRGASGLLVSGGIRWGPGFYAGISTPFLKIPLFGEEPAVDLKTFRLRNATLLPPLPEPTPAVVPTPAVTPRGD